MSHITWRLAHSAALVLILSACAPGTSATKRIAEPPDLWAMTIMAGRYGVMLSQARGILSLAEPAPGRDVPYPADDRDETKERRALAEQQVKIAAAYFADTAHACAKADLPASILGIACNQQTEAPARLLKRAALKLDALQARNDELGALIMPWWDAACAIAKAESAEPDAVCPME